MKFSTDILNYGKNGYLSILESWTLTSVHDVTLKADQRYHRNGHIIAIELTDASFVLF